MLKISARNSLIVSLFLLAIALPLFSAAQQVQEAQGRVDSLAPIPAALKPWIGWVTNANPQYACSIANGTTQCVWPAKLLLDLNADGASFSVSGVAQKSDFIKLPGSVDSAWPINVTKGAGLTVIEKDSAPWVFVQQGAFQISGKFKWANRPSTLQVPNEIAIIEARENAKTVAISRNLSLGSIAFVVESRGAQPISERLQIRVNRLLTDGQPFTVTVLLAISYAGPSKTITIKDIIPAGAKLINSSSTVPYSIRADGVQLALIAGDQQAIFELAFAQLNGKLELPHPTGNGVLDAENWVFKAKPEFRVVQLSGVTAVSQEGLDLPAQWQELPTYSVTKTSMPELVQANEAADVLTPGRIELTRNVWPQTKNQPWIFLDSFSGRLAGQSRIDSEKNLNVAQAVIDGQRSLITANPESDAIGVELRNANINAQLQSTLGSTRANIAAIGWQTDVDSLRWMLNLQPGTRLIFAKGFERSVGTWVLSWTLLDVFLLIFVTAVVAKVFGLIPAVAVFALQLIGFQEPALPFWLILFSSIAAAVTGKIRLMPFVKIILLGLLCLNCYEFSVRQIKLALNPTLTNEAPVYSSSMLRSAPQKTSVDLEELEYNDDKITNSTKTFFTFLEGSFGALVMVFAFGIGVVFLVKRRFQDAGIVFALAALVFVGRSFTGTYFGADSNTYDSSVSSRQQGAAESMPFAGESLGGGAAGATMMQDLEMDDATDDNFDSQSLGLIQTAGGTPSTNGEIVKLWTDGVVKKDQIVKLWIAPVWLVSALRLLLVTAFITLLLGIFKRFGLRSVLSINPGTALPSLLFVILSVLPNIAAADSFPSPELLTQLQARLERDRCLGDCAAINTLEINATRDLVTLTMTVVSRANGAVALPGRMNEAQFSAVQLDGAAASALRADERGFIWLAVPAGEHIVKATLISADTNRFTLSILNRIGSISANITGWQLSGVDEFGRVSAALELTRILSSSSATDSLKQEETVRDAITPQPWFMINRIIEVGARWKVKSTIERIGTSNGTQTARIRLLDGEFILNNNQRVVNGWLEVVLPAGQNSVGIETEIKASPSTTLRASAEFGYSEDWQINCSREWRCTTEGLTKLASTDSNINSLHFAPLPGAELKLSVQALVAAPGAAVSVTAAHVIHRATLRQITSSIVLNITSSVAESQTLTLPENAKLISVQVNQRPVASSLVNGQLALPIALGEHRYLVEFSSEPQGKRPSELSVPQFSLPLTNLTVTYYPPAENWILTTSSADNGPIVLFWPKLFAIILFAIGLGTYRVAATGIIAWLLFAVGLSTLEISNLIFPAAWLIFNAWLSKNPAPPRFRILLQLTWILLTIVAFVLLVGAIRQGLLFAPQMQLVGNGSSSNMLNWYFTNWPSSQFGQPMLFNISVWWWRGLMLIWSLWLTLFILARVRLGYQALARDGFLKNNTAGKV